MAGNTRCAAFGIIIGIFISCLFLWTSNVARSNDDDRTVSYNTRQSSLEYHPEVDFSLLKSKNSTDDLTETLRAKYGAVRISGIRQINTVLSEKEEQAFQTCVKNGATDRARNGSKFWPVQQIRRTHHSYLSEREDAVMMEVGGNRGDDASEFVRLYNPRYIILEPLEEYAQILTNKFKDNSRVTVLNLGLGAKNEVVMVKIEGDNACATSKFSGSGGKIPLYITNATEFLLKIGIGTFDIDLLTMNCEGCEFEALETILSTTLINHIKNLQFATHSTIKGLLDPIPRYCRIQQLLMRTHRPTYQYKFIWESWRRMDIP